MPLRLDLLFDWTDLSHSCRIDYFFSWKFNLFLVILAVWYSYVIVIDGSCLRNSISHALFSATCTLRQSLILPVWALDSSDKLIEKYKKNIFFWSQQFFRHHKSCSTLHLCLSRSWQPLFHVFIDRTLIFIAPAAPRNLKLVERTSSSLTVTWEAPLRSSSKIDAYRITLWKGFWKEMAEKRGIEIRPSASKLQYNIDDLDSNSQYNIEVNKYDLSLNYFSKKIWTAKPRKVAYVNTLSPKNYVSNKNNVAFDKTWRYVWKLLMWLKPTLYYLMSYNDNTHISRISY